MQVREGAGQHSGTRKFTRVPQDTISYHIRFLQDTAKTRDALAPYLASDYRSPSPFPAAGRARLQRKQRLQGLC